MSAALSHPPRAVSPVDRDLQILYDEVWAGFAAEDTQSPEKDLDGIYSVYGSDSDYVSPVTPSSAVSGTYLSCNFPKRWPQLLSRYLNRWQQ